MNASNIRIIVLPLIISILAITPIFASCGSCQVQSEADISKKSSAFITTIPKSGDIEGFVISSCGMCGFGYKKIIGCSLTIKIGDIVYPVEGTKIHNHGDPHSKEGFCNALRVAYVSGKIKDDKFYSNSFTLMESPK